MFVKQVVWGLVVGAWLTGACGGSTVVGSESNAGRAGGAGAPPSGAGSTAAGAPASAGAGAASGEDAGSGDDAGAAGAGAISCTYLGETHHGEQFPDRDGCNTCWCGSVYEGMVQIECTQALCACTGSEWFRDYKATSPASCQTVKFACPEQTERFSDDCGCGCEQSEACAKVLSCSGDCAEEQASCPYSELPR